MLLDNDSKTKVCIQNFKKQDITLNLIKEK